MSRGRGQSMRHPPREGWDRQREPDEAHLLRPYSRPQSQITLQSRIEPRANLYPIDNERPQSAAPVKTNLPRLTLMTDYTMWRNAVECIIEVTGATIQQVVAQIISAMDGDTMYRAQNVLSDFKRHYGASPRRSNQHH
ncbi:Hypothetical protein FKW44_023002 [Caligus rogercresseyi]|uniref:Uncharacterized protein n=1 Tax=Caligus rogercresseyi TaxID=217165 RepID=A0A7T8GNB6_CALRO|nr:Hypothetical protein FKW44_023002 [Caligus rogercresseyi]